MAAAKVLAHLALAVALGAGALAACGGARSSPAATVAAAPASPAPASRNGGLTSNVTRDDYAGSAACTPCHADVAAAWSASPMHRMTRSSHGATVRAPFDGTRWPFKDDAVVLETRAGQRLVRIEHGGAAAKTYRVTRVIGGRTREDFAGIDVQGGREELVLPVSFVYATRALRYKGYSVMVHERASLRAGPVWSRACIFCHNTVPELDRMLGAFAGPHAHPYQGEQVERWLPPERRLVIRVTDDAGFERAADAEIARLGGAPPVAGGDARAVSRRAIEVVRDGFDGGALVEEGIGCEACHGGAREHVRSPGVHPSLVPVAPWLEVDPPRGATGTAPSATFSRALAVNRACARCHQVLFSRYPYTWEGGRRDAGAGGSHINSGEARDFLLGGCASAMACTTCHDPHGADDPAALRALATPAGNAKCAPCHEAQATRVREHAHHDPRGAGGACIACHMPRKNMGLDGALTRYHRIGSPTDAARVLGDRPLECALCHADRSVRQLADAMEAWWPVRYPRQRLEELYGSLDANVMRATLERGRPHEQAVAIGTLAEAHAVDAAPLVRRELANEYPLVREWASRALTAMGAAGAPGSPAAGAAPSAAAPAAAGAAARDEDPED